MSARSRRCAVLDIETAPDHHAHTLSRRRGGAPRGSPIHEIVNASMLTFVEDEEGDLDNFQLSSWNLPTYGEADILANVDAALVGVADDGGRLVTFNGIGHDLPTLRMRQVRWWMCDAVGAERIQQGDAEHIDVMLELSGGAREGGRRWPMPVRASASP